MPENLGIPQGTGLSASPVQTPTADGLAGEFWRAWQHHQLPDQPHICVKAISAYEDKKPVIFKDAWSAGGRNSKGALNAIYCVLQIYGQIHVATSSAAKMLLRGTNKVTLQRCEERGIAFDLPKERDSLKRRAVKPSRESAAVQQGATNSPQDAEISGIRAQVGYLNSKLSELTLMMGKLMMGGSAL
ncbi:hypothetical protein V8F33_013526 [Rhypophila sp. PSN 637]